jgi:DNA-binding NtrC family response regulator
MSAPWALPPLDQTGGALVASPSSPLRGQIFEQLNGRCSPLEQVQGGAEALAKLERGHWQTIFLDRHLPDLDAEELARVIERRFPEVRIVLVDSGTAHPPSDSAADFIRHDNRNHELRANPEVVSRSFALLRPQGSDPQKNASGAPLPGMIGTSVSMQRVYRMVRLVSGRTTTVLITGATGTGKELVARALHNLSPRSAKPLVVVNCAAIPEALLESELFGYSRGAFTGAVQSQLGRFAAAHGGTLFLDEVSELPLGMQAKLLRFLEQKEIQRLGTCETTRVDVRVLAASNVDLSARAERGEFRQDLYYRLAAFPIELPALAERGADILPLAENFLACMAAAMELPTPRLGDEAIRLLEAHAWKGNVRELQHVMERASILANGCEIIEAEHLYFPGQTNPAGLNRSPTGFGPSDCSHCAESEAAAS